MVDLTLLADADLFSAIAADDLEVIGQAALPRELQRNEILFSEGDDATSLFVVETGRIAVANVSDEGRESLIALMERGDVVGEMGMFAPQTRSAQAKALEPTTGIELPYGPVLALFDEKPRLLWHVVTLLTSRLRAVDLALADTMFLDVTGRTAKRLLELSGDLDEFVLPITQEELAGMVGASRERVNKAIASFVRLGWVDQRDRTYRIVDREQLSRRAR